MATNVCVEWDSCFVSSSLRPQHLPRARHGAGPRAMSVGSQSGGPRPTRPPARPSGQGPRRSPPRPHGAGSGSWERPLSDQAPAGKVGSGFSLGAQHCWARALRLPPPLLALPPPAPANLGPGSAHNKPSRCPPGPSHWLPSRPACLPRRSAQMPRLQGRAQATHPRPTRALSLPLLLGNACYREH